VTGLPLLLLPRFASVMVELLELELFRTNPAGCGGSDDGENGCSMLPLDNRSDEPLLRREEPFVEGTSKDDP
jgi:hypothetical protein